MERGFSNKAHQFNMVHVFSSYIQAGGIAWGNGQE